MTHFYHPRLLNRHGVSTFLCQGTETTAEVFDCEPIPNTALDLYPDDMSALGNGACLQAKLGHADRAIELLERVSAQGWGQRDWLERDPDYDSLRDDPRFQRLVKTFK